jgi:ATP phosphoribosyltransferase
MTTDNKAFDNYSALAIALPDGSLLKKERGDIPDYIHRMNIGINGYSEEDLWKNPTSDYEYFHFYTDRPQNMPHLLKIGVYDYAILGKDIIEEFSGDSIPILDLHTGRASIMAAIADTPEFRDLKNLYKYIWDRLDKGYRIKIVTEDPVVAQRMLLEDDDIRPLMEGKLPRIIYHGKSISIDSHYDNGDVSDKFEIYVTSGNTESVARNILDRKEEHKIEPIIVDRVQSGNSLRKAGFKPLYRSTVVSSSAMLYRSPHVLESTKKIELAIEFLINLESVVLAKTHDKVELNVLEPDLDNVLRYIQDRTLFMEYPTIVPPFKTKEPNTDDKEPNTDDKEPEEWFQIITVAPSDSKQQNEMKRDLFACGAREIIFTEPKAIYGVRGRDYKEMLVKGISD